MDGDIRRYNHGRQHQYYCVVLLHCMKVIYTRNGWVGGGGGGGTNVEYTCTCIFTTTPVCRLTCVHLGLQYFNNNMTIENRLHASCNNLLFSF